MLPVSIHTHIHQSHTKTRNLFSEEIALFPKNFCNVINIQAVRLINCAHNPFATKKILVRHNQIFWPGCPDNFANESIEIQAPLMHEFCHVWQYHTGRLTALGYLTNPFNWMYNYKFKTEKDFDDYPIEKQADLMQDWFRLNMGYKACRHASATTPPTCQQINAIIPFDWQDKTPVQRALPVS